MRSLCKAYFWLLIVLVAISHLLDPPDFSQYGAFDYINIVMGITMLVGVFGYVYRVAVLKKEVWKYFLPIIICWHFLGIYRTITQASPEQITSEAIGLVLLVYLALFVPGYTALYFYSYKDKSRNLWNT